ncbi:MAG TPA: hypothetical protein VHQ86_01860 [Candidatus Saccharimonadia bacterium]|nr:hypothetical protein [Candidatus Saccharimonadia bacterium]
MDPNYQPSTNPNQTNPLRARIILISTIAVGAIIGVIIIVYAVIQVAGNKGGSSPQPTKTSNATPAPTLPPLDVNPPAEAVTVITAYVQARENSVGADQSSPTAWLATVRPLLTPTYFATIQPPADGSTSTGSAEYTTAHANGYTVKALVTDCVWDIEQGQPTDAGGSIACTLNDETHIGTNNLNSNQVPFGWSRIGRQSMVVMKMVKQNGAWLINKDDSENE